MTPTTLSAHLRSWFGQHRPDTSSEAALQACIADAFATIGDNLRYVREWRLSPRDRPDFGVWRFDAMETTSIAVEVKCKGGLSDLTRQVYRYAEHEAVAGILVVTTRNLHRGLPTVVLAKPCATLILADYLL